LLLGGHSKCTTCSRTVEDVTLTVLKELEFILEDANELLCKSYLQVIIIAEPN
jgi:hypothetical protein